MSQNQIQYDKFDSWWNGLNKFAKKELYNYWEGKNAR